MGISTSGSSQGARDSSTPSVPRARDSASPHWCTLFTTRPIDSCTAALVTTGNRALLRLSLEPQPLEDLVELLLLDGLPTPAIQLALCAASSDVFGGMGSWNDMSFAGQTGETYVSLSDRLFAATRTALRSSLNHSAM